MAKDYFSLVRKNPKRTVTIRLNDEEFRMIEELKQRKQVNRTDVIAASIRALYDLIRNEK